MIKQCFHSWEIWLTTFNHNVIRGGSTMNWVTRRRFRQVGIIGPHCFLCGLWESRQFKSPMKLIIEMVFWTFSSQISGFLFLCVVEPDRGGSGLTWVPPTKHRHRDAYFLFTLLRKRDFLCLPSHFHSSDPLNSSAVATLANHAYFHNPEKYFRQWSVGKCSATDSRKRAHIRVLVSVHCQLGPA